MRAMALLVVTFAVLPARAEETAASKQFQELLEQYETEGGARIFAKKFLAFAEHNPKEPTALNAATWVIKKVRGKSDTDRALELLEEHHALSDEIGKSCRAIAGSRSVVAERVLQKIIEKNTDESIRAQACMALAQLLDSEANVIEQLKSQPELAPRILQYYGRDYGKHLSSLDSAELEKRREQVYALMLKRYSKVEFNDTTMGEVAAKALFAIRRLSIGKVAPEIVGTDIAGKPMKLSEFRGKVVMLSFWAHW